MIIIIIIMIIIIIPMTVIIHSLFLCLFFSFLLPFFYPAFNCTLSISSLLPLFSSARFLHHSLIEKAPFKYLVLTTASFYNNVDSVLSVHFFTSTSSSLYFIIFHHLIFLHNLIEKALLKKLAVPITKLSFFTTMWTLFAFFCLAYCPCMSFSI